MDLSPVSVSRNVDNTNFRSEKFLLKQTWHTYLISPTGLVQLKVAKVDTWSVHLPLDLAETSCPSAHLDSVEKHLHQDHSSAV